MASVVPGADFNGVWTSVRSEKLAEFLISQGMDEKVAKLAATKEVTQEITQDGKMFTVKTGSHTKSYVIGGSGNLKEVFGNMMLWEGSELVSKPFYMNTSEGAVETRRCIVNGEMVMKMRNEKGETTRYFKRVQTAVQPVTKPATTTQPVQPATTAKPSKSDTKKT
uniref:Cytosolic fatty-acid binding proteins domain-containing protein n=1 Tax=Lotharella globosa TaxID=91324 RepID=A0A7S3ZFC1_9EUKA